VGNEPILHNAYYNSFHKFLIAKSPVFAQYRLEHREWKGIDIVVLDLVAFVGRIVRLGRLLCQPNVLHVHLGKDDPKIFEHFRSNGTEWDDERSMAVSRISLQRLVATGGIRTSAANRVYPGVRLLPIHPSWGPGVRGNSTVAGQPTASPPPPPLQNVISSLMTLQTEI